MFGRILVILLLLLVLIGCKKNDFNKLAKPDWNPELAVPLVKSSLAIEDVLDKAGEQDYLEVDNENMITLVYASRLYSMKGNEFLKIPDVFTVLSDSLTVLGFPFTGGKKLEDVDLLSGRMKYSISSNDTNDVSLNLRLPFVTKSDKPLDETFLLNYQESTPIYNSGSFDLSGYRIDFTSGGNYTNSVLMEYQAQLVSNLSNVTSSYPINISFEDLLFQYADGYLGMLNFDMQSDTLVLSIFKNWVQGTVHLENPHIAFEVQNSYGLPITADFSTFEAWSDVGGSTIIPITSNTTIGDTFTVSYPGPSEIGQSLNFNYELNDANSNISSVISICPKELRYALYFIANAEADITQNNFITNESELSIDLDLKLPMHGRIDGVLIQDTFALDIGTEEILQQLETAKFKLQTQNKLPLDVSLQVYFADANYYLLDSLLTKEEVILRSGTVDGTGKVTQPRDKITFIDYDRQRSANIDLASNMILKVRLSTINDGATSIKLFSDYFLGVKLGVIANPHLN